LGHSDTTKFGELLMPLNLTVNTSQILTIKTPGPQGSPGPAGAGSSQDVAGLVSGSTSAAAANTAAIQTALTAGGVVTVMTAGIFYINATLIYGGNTRLSLGVNTTIRLAPNSNCPMLMSSSLVSALAGGTTFTGGTAVTLTQGVAGAVNVQWTAHGRAVSSGCWLMGSTVSGYNGVFRVAAVVDANNFTIYTTKYQTSAPAGTILALPAIRNFNLFGGVWDYDSANQTTTASTYQCMGLFFVGLLDSTIENVTVTNPVKFAYYLLAALNCRLKTIRGYNPNSDVLKIYGPCNAINIDGLAGNSADDFISIQTKEFSPFTYAQFSASGDVYDVTVKNISGYAASAGVIVHLYPSDTESMDLIHIEQVTGQTATVPPIQINRPTGASVGSIGRVTFKNVQATAEITNTPVFTFFNCSVDLLTIEDCSISPGSSVTSSGDNWLSMTGNAVIAELVMNRIKSNNWPSTTGNGLFIYVNGAQIGRWVMCDCVVKGGIGTAYLIQFASTTNTLGELILDGCYFDATVNALCYFSALLASGTPVLSFKNIVAAGLARGIRFGVAQNAHIRFLGSTIGVTANGIIDTSASNTLKISSDGANDLTGTFINITAGTPVLTMYGNDLKYDAGLLATTQGQFFYHSSAVAGRNATNQQGLCIGVDGTHFYAMGTGTSGVNTLIV
jgi:hypothetical protein